MTLVLGVCRRRNVSAGELTAAVRVWEAISEGVAGFGLAVEEGETLVILVFVRESWKEGTERGVTLGLSFDELPPTSISCPTL